LALKTLQEVDCPSHPCECSSHVDKCCPMKFGVGLPSFICATVVTMTYTSHSLAHRARPHLACPPSNCVFVTSWHLFGSLSTSPLFVLFSMQICGLEPLHAACSCCLVLVVSVTEAEHRGLHPVGPLVLQLAGANIRGSSNWRGRSQRPSVLSQNSSLVWE
jgi:hypothetical protein